MECSSWISQYADLVEVIGGQLLKQTLVVRDYFDVELPCDEVGLEVDHEQREVLLEVGEDLGVHVRVEQQEPVHGALERDDGCLCSPSSMSFVS